MTDRDKLPLVVLAGSDPKPAQLPERGADKHPLAGPKGLQIVIGGVPLIDLLTHRLRELGYFDPMFIVGPRSSYGDSRDGVEVVDSDGSFGENIRAAIRTVEARCPGCPVAFTVCDIFPEPEEMRALMDDYFAHRPVDFWFPMILAPDARRLGASDWKPQYKMAMGDGRPPQAILPGHLVVVDPAAMRQEFIFRSFDLAYRSRNRPMTYRFFYIVTHLLLFLLGRDLGRLLHLRPPTVTATIVFQAAVIVRKMLRHSITSEELARRWRLIFVRTEHRREHPERKGRLPLMVALSLAKDMDTREEAEELARHLASGTEIS
jgi:hypothetical protein